MSRIFLSRLSEASMAKSNDLDAIVAVVGGKA
jgi:hypothetical protein